MLLHVVTGLWRFVKMQPNDSGASKVPDVFQEPPLLELSKKVWERDQLLATRWHTGETGPSAISPVSCQLLAPAQRSNRIQQDPGSNSRTRWSLQSLRSLWTCCLAFASRWSGDKRTCITWSFLHIGTGFNKSHTSQWNLEIYQWVMHIIRIS